LSSNTTLSSKKDRVFYFSVTNDKTKFIGSRFLARFSDYRVKKFGLSTFTGTFQRHGSHNLKARSVAPQPKHLQDASPDNESKHVLA